MINLNINHLKLEWREDAEGVHAFLYGEKKASITKDFRLIVGLLVSKPMKSLDAAKEKIEELLML